MTDPHPDQHPRPRPTLRCLRDDLKLPLPPADRPLDEVDHPVLHKAREQFADPDTPHERILAIDDQLLCTLKIQVGIVIRAAATPTSDLHLLATQ